MSMYPLRTHLSNLVHMIFVYFGATRRRLYCTFFASCQCTNVVWSDVGAWPSSRRGYQSAPPPRPPPFCEVLDEPIRRHLEHGRILVENSPRRAPDTSSTRIFVEKLIHRKVIDHCGKLCHCTSASPEASAR